MTERTSQQARYHKWIWESLKMVGGAAIAALIVLQVKLAEIRSELDAIKLATEKEITNIHGTIREIKRTDEETQAMILRTRDEASTERRGIEQRLESVKDMIRDHELEIARRDLRNVLEARDAAKAKKP